MTNRGSVKRMVAAVPRADLNERADVRAAPARRGGGKPIAGVGRVYFWNGGSLWLGRGAGRGQPHAHHAIQITLALDGRFLLREHEDSAWSEFQGAIVLPHRRHQFDGCGNGVAQLFVEPETAPGHALLQRFEGAPIEALPLDMLDAMLGLVRDGIQPASPDEELIAAGQRAIALLVEQAPSGSVADPRILNAIAEIQARLAGPLRLGDAAAAAHLSPSRFRHLFTLQTGTVFRAYVLWLRLQVAIRAAMAGQSWTAAAHEAGFADSAHLSRTFRRMFGIVPAMIVIDPPRDRRATATSR
jgi:AraC family transcriptional regulator